MILRHLAALLAAVAVLPAAAQTISGQTIRAGTTPLTAVVTQSANTLVGNCTGSTASPTACTAAAAKTSLAITSSDVSGLAASATTDTTNAANISSGTLPCARLPALTGDVTTTAGGCATNAAGSIVKSISLTTPNLTYSSPVTFSVSGGAATGALSLLTQSANVVFAGPSSGSAETPTWRALVTADLPSGTGTVTSFGSGNLSPLFTTSVATATTTPALTFTLSTAAAHNFLGNNTGSTAAPAYVQPAFTDLSGSLACSQRPAETGDVTSSAGSCATTVGAINGTSLGGLATGLLKNTTSTGVPSIAVANTDYLPVASPTATGLLSTGRFTMSGGGGSFAAWQLAPPGFNIQSATFTDTTSSGTNSNLSAVYAINAPTVAASSATTYSTGMVTLYIAGPVAGTNVTNGNPYTLYIAGSSRYTGILSGTGGASFSNSVVALNNNSNFATNINTGTSTGTFTAGNTTGPGLVSLAGPVTVFAGTATLTPLKMTSGTLNTTTVAGAIEYDGTSFYMSPSTTRLQVVEAKASDGHIQTPSSTPVISSCGTSPTTTGTQSDHAGTITAGTGATSCTVTFGTAYTTAPHCTVTEQSPSLTNIFSYTESTSAIVVSQTGLAGNTFDYVCLK